MVGKKMASPYVLGLINALHDIFTSLWIGGLAFMIIILIPVVRKFFEEKEQGELFLTKIQKRLKIMAVISMIGLVATGGFMSRQAAAKGILAARGYRMWHF